MSSQVHQHSATSACPYKAKSTAVVGLASVAARLTFADWVRSSACPHSYVHQHSATSACPSAAKSTVATGLNSAFWVRPSACPRAARSVRLTTSACPYSAKSTVAAGPTLQIACDHRPASKQPCPPAECDFGLPVCSQVDCRSPAKSTVAARLSSADYVGLSKCSRFSGGIVAG